ncbi:DUF397 domain-containing protein [Streptomyces sp. NPDC007162]|uniref:DUF397 domain-containing protein n=1 Tax=Streptomyces sp. NPDC007162 TaxID=3156917 RepID=UPI0033DE12C4
MAALVPRTSHRSRRRPPPSHIPVRDSEAPSYGTLLLDASAWAAFVDGVKLAR